MWKVCPKYLWCALIEISDRKLCNCPWHYVLTEQVLRRQQCYFQRLQPFERKSGLIVGWKCPKVERLIQVQLLELSPGADREDLPWISTLRPGIANCNLAQNLAIVRVQNELGQELGAQVIDV